MKKTLCRIRVGDDEWHWLFTLFRPGHQPYEAECLIVVAGHEGEPMLDIHWKGQEHPPGVAELLTNALNQRIRQILPSDIDLVELERTCVTPFDAPPCSRLEPFNCPGLLCTQCGRCSVCSKRRGPCEGRA